jgi:hypothetical protein
VHNLLNINGGRGRNRTCDQSIKSRKMVVLQGVAARCTRMK